MEQVIIGVDPHKLSATIEVVDQHERKLGDGRFATDQARLPRDADLCQDVAGSGLGHRGRHRHRTTFGSTAARGR